MSTKVKISCPTCDKKIGGVEDSSRYYYQDFDDMIELFGLTRSGKSQKQSQCTFMNQSSMFKIPLKQLNTRGN